MVLRRNQGVDENSFRECERRVPETVPEDNCPARGSQQEMRRAGGQRKVGGYWSLCMEEGFTKRKCRVKEMTQENQLALIMLMGNMEVLGTILRERRREKGSGDGEV